jgi:hypothetical protein
LGGPLRIRVDASGWISPEDQARLTAFVIGYQDAQIMVFADERRRRSRLRVRRRPVPPQAGQA